MPIGKHERRFAGFDDKIVVKYAGGMCVREIQAHLAELYPQQSGLPRPGGLSGRGATCSATETAA